MELVEILKLFLQYALVPLATVGWYMFKKQDTRLDNLEKRTSETEKAVIEIKTEFKYVSRDIKDIKNMVTKLSEK